MSENMYKALCVILTGNFIIFVIPETAGGIMYYDSENSIAKTGL